MSHKSHNVCVVLGAQWGDEGKGKVTDMLAQEADIVCRAQGGNNCDHMVVVNNVQHIHHMLPCGIINDNCQALIGNGCVVHVPQLLEEIRVFEANGIRNCKERLLISDRAHLVFDFHQSLDRHQEKAKENASIGTTKKGIGPAYATKAYRTGIRMADLIGDFNIFEKKFKCLLADICSQMPDLSIDVNVSELSLYKRIADELRPCVTDTVSYLNKCIRNGQSVVIEGANATMLDIDCGTYPYVTSSQTTAGGVCTGLGIAPGHIKEVYGVVKAYSTRVGEGPFPTELFDERGEQLFVSGNEIAMTTGRRRRCGWLDVVCLRYAHMINDFTAIAITKLDILDAFEEIKIAVSYVLDGKKFTHAPPDMAKVEVEYITLKGWQTSIANIIRFADLPTNAQNYVRAIETLMDVKVKWVGVGPERQQTITLF